MGASLARNLHENGWRVTGFNHSPAATQQLEKEGIGAAYSLPELIEKIPQPRTIWLMVPHQAVDSVIDELAPLLSEGDTIIDGGNSPYKESVRRFGALSARSINFLDAGAPGGPAGAQTEAHASWSAATALYMSVTRLCLEDATVPDGYFYAGKPGAGHFVKMVHNGIEYGMMQAIAEGFEILRTSKLDIDVAATAALYDHGSVMSRLMQDA